MFRKKEKPLGLPKQAIWVVTWRARYGGYRDDFTTKVKAFNNEQDAKDFVAQLKKAKEILCYRERIHVSIEKQ